MGESEFSSSPDPIILPSSPPSAHLRYRSGGPKHGQRRSPAKSFVIDTPATRGKSPWRIRLTVEPQPELDVTTAHHQTLQLPYEDDVLQQSSPIEQRPTTSRTSRTRDNKPVYSPSSRKRKRALAEDHVQQNFKSLASAIPTASRSMLPPSLASIKRARTANRAFEQDDVAGEQTMANEDFTMISGDSLASIKANNSLIVARERASRQADPNIDPQLNDWPSAIEYPDLGDELAAEVINVVETVAPPSTRATLQVQDYDALAWQPTAEYVSDDSSSQPGDRDNTAFGAQPTSGGTEEDIWAEEASRPVEDEAPVHNIAQHDNMTIPPIFSDDPQPPRRTKIPKPWRDRSGDALTYSDSPVQPNKIGQVNAVADDEMHKTGVSIPSPPQTDENAGLEPYAHPAQLVQKDLTDDSDITNPDAAGTQLQTHEATKQHRAHDSTTPKLPAPAAVTPSADETGLFWRTNRQTLFSKGPQRPRHTRSTLPDLDGILNAQTPYSNRGVGAKTKPVDRHRNDDGNEGKQGASPVAVAPATTPSRPASHLYTAAPRPEVNVPEKMQTAPISSAKASRMNTARTSRAANVNQQGVHDMRHRSVTSRPRTAAERSQNADAKPKSFGRKYFGKQTAEPIRPKSSTGPGNDASQSYEEHLNRMSPDKLRIKFNEVEHHIPSNDRLKASKAYPSLFDAKRSRLDHDSSTSDEAEELALDKARGTSPSLSSKQEPGFINKWASVLWSAVVRPRDPIYTEPENEPLPQDEPSFPVTLRAKIRSRYGVLQERHPWTMMHMRTLHRMVKSVTSRGGDSMIPTTLRLPQYLDDIVDTHRVSAVGDRFPFTFDHACAVWTFMQILVPVSLIRAIERGEVEWLGDRITTKYRGQVAGRWGNELCFRTISTPAGAIDWQWLVACVGCIVFAEDLARLRES